MRRRTLVAGGALAGAAAVLPRLAKADDAMIAGRFAATLSAHDIDAFAALFAEGYVNHQVSAAAPPPPAGTTPKAATVAFFAARLKALPDLKVTIETTVAEADKVAASFVYEGRQEGPYYGIEPTHKRLRFTSCDIFRVANGQIVEHWGMGDIAGVVAQMRG
ncbi:MAG TPA: ester cyclase [Roseiarcus sp.]|nr:ester cyclase [Roseiarcus sp.]